MRQSAARNNVLCVSRLIDRHIATWTLQDRRFVTRPNLVQIAICLTYLAVTAALFIFWRGLDLDAFLQVGLIALYSLLTIYYCHWAYSTQTVPATISVPTTLLIMLSMPIFVPSILPYALVALTAVMLWRLSGFRSITIQPPWWLVSCLIVGFLLASSQFAVVNSFRYASVFVDTALESGAMFRDTLFHSAIVSIIREQGVASTGLHGLPQITYYVGVHRWMAGLSKITGSSSPLTLAMGVQLFILPVMLYTFLRALGPMKTGAEGLLLSLAAVFALWGMQMTVGASYLVGESYALSLLLMLAGFPIGLRWINPDTRLSKLVVAEIGVVVALVLCTGLIKASTGYVLATYLFGCLFVLVYKTRPALAVLSFLILGVIAAGLCLVLYLYYFDPALFPLHPFHFSSTWPKTWYKSLLAAALMIAALLALRPATYSMSFIAILVYFAACIPGQTFAFPGVGGAYFTQPALIIVALLLLRALIQRFSRYSNARTSLIALATLVVLVSFGILLPKFGDLIDRQAWYERFATDADMFFASNGFNTYGSSAPLAQIANRLKAMSTEKEERALVYVPPDNIVVWRGEGDVCWSKSFVIPAMTGIPLLAGVRGRPVDCENTPYYGMVPYGERALNRPLNQSESCSEALALGFSVVYRLDDGVNITRVDCSESK